MILAKFAVARAEKLSAWYRLRRMDSLLLHHADWLASLLTGRRDTSDWNNTLKLGYDPEAQCYPDWLLAQVSCAVLCCAVLCCAVLCCDVLCCAVLCCAVLCCAVLCCAVLCCAVLSIMACLQHKRLWDALNLLDCIV